MGREQIWIGSAPVRWAAIRAHRAPGARDRVAGGRTSVSAPLGDCPQITDPMGSQKPWIVQQPPLDAQPKTPSREGPNTRWRGGGPLCPLRWALLRRSPTRWAAEDHGSANNPPLGTQPKTPSRKGPTTGWRGGGPLCPLRWTRGRNTPDIGRALACIRSFSTPWGEKVPEGGMRGQPARHALCHTPTNHPALSPSPQPSPTVTRVRLLGRRSVGEGATRGGAAGLAADLIHQPTRGRWGLGRRFVVLLIHASLTNRLISLFHNRADLCVRSAGRQSEDHRPDGQPKTMDRPTVLPLDTQPKHPFARAQPQGGGALAAR